MELEKIWTKFNISFILILPIFKKLFYNCKHKSGYNVSIHTFLYDIGLIDTYLLDKNSIYHNKLYLLFDKDILINSPKLITKNKLLLDNLELLINFEDFSNIEITDKYIIIALSINDRWKKDIVKIKQSKYSQVSEDYKNFILNKGIYHLSNEPIVNYLAIENVPVKIIKKHLKLEESIKFLFNMNHNEVLSELFPKFNIINESLNPHLL